MAFWARVLLFLVILVPKFALGFDVDPSLSTNSNNCTVQNYTNSAAQILCKQKMKDFMSANFNSANEQSFDYSQCLADKGFQTCNIDTLPQASIVNPGPIDPTKDQGDSKFVSGPQITPLSTGTGTGTGGANTATNPKPAPPSMKKTAPASADDTSPSGQSADTSSCSTAASNVNSNCQMPQTNYQSSQGGVGSTCGQMNTATNSQVTALNNAYGNCMSAITSCTSLCDSLAAKWQDTDANIAANFTSYSAQCNGYQGTATNMYNQVNQLTSQTPNSYNCNQNSGGSPASTANNNSSTNPASSMTAMGAPASASATDCSNPVAARSSACAPATTASQDKNTNSASMNSASTDGGSGASTFNTADASLGQRQGQQFPSFASGKQAPASANGMGGGGGGAGGMAPASQSANNQNSNNPKGGAGAGRSLASADILKGERGGGSGFTYGGPETKEKQRRLAGGEDGFRMPAGIGKGKDYRGLDLKSYLPGGQRDPNMRAAGLSVTHPDIHGQSENMFSAVSGRFQIHCKLNMFDCR
jgi:hypothetical protein